MNIDDPKYKNNVTLTRDSRAAYRAENKRITELVRADLEEENFSKDVPGSVRDEVWTRAWEHGHASGFSDVAYYYDDFATLASLAFTAGKNARSAP